MAGNFLKACQFVFFCRNCLQLFYGQQTLHTHTHKIHTYLVAKHRLTFSLFFILQDHQILYNNRGLYLVKKQLCLVTSSQKIPTRNWQRFYGIEVHKENRYLRKYFIIFWNIFDLITFPVKRNDFIQHILSIF